MGCAKRLNRSRCRFRRLTLVVPRSHGLDGRTNPFAAVRGDKLAMRPFARLLWTFVIRPVAVYRCRQKGSYEMKWFISLFDVSLEDRVNVQGITAFVHRRIAWFLAVLLKVQYGATKAHTIRRRGRHFGHPCRHAVLTDDRSVIVGILSGHSHWSRAVT